MKRSLLCPVVLLLGLPLTPLYAQRDARVPDPDPEIERKALQVADGFEVNLFAADPLLAKPIQMNFDPAGRLWVACSEAYPQIKPGQKANDKIIVLEDSNGDGKADRTTVFADGLLIPTGLEPGDGGVYVGASTDLLHLSRPDGDKGPLRRRVVLSGFGTEDTHHLVHTLRWGPDGNLYFNQSVYIHSHIETPYGPRRLGGGGVWQLRPDTLRLEVFARGWWNPWGHHFDRWGQSFVTDGAGTEGVYPIIPGGNYTPVVVAGRVLQGLNPGSPKYCGCEILSGRHLPEEWRGNLLTNDFRGHRVCRFVLAPDGSGYTARLQNDLIKTNHPAFRPIDVKMGPDGAIYIADWYNPIIQHGEVDFRDPRRDVTHGRIWRVTAKGRPLVARPKLAGASTPELLDALKAPEDWSRHNARRVLTERGKSVVPELAAWVARLDRRSAENEPHLLEALWTYQSLDVVEPKLLAALLGASDYRVRAAAVRVVSAWHDRLGNPLDLLASRVADDHPQVRLEAVRALGVLADVRAAEVALTALDRPVDRNLDYALWLTMRELQAQWLPALQQGRLRVGNPRRLLFALQAVGSPAVVGPLVEMVRTGKVPEDNAEGVLTLIAALGGPTELNLLLDHLSGKGMKPVVRAALLEALGQAARQRGVRPAGDLARLVLLLKDQDEAVQAAAVRLAGAWRLEAARPLLTEYARGEKTSETLRRAALDGLAALGGKESVAALEGVTRDGPPAARRMALAALVSLDTQAAAGRAVDVLARLARGEEAGEVFTAFLQHRNGAALLAEALKGRKLPADVARVGVRTVRVSGRPASELLDALTQAGGLTFGVRKLTAAERDRLAADVGRLGDAARGEAVFRRRDQLCLTCHAIGGAGGQVGPDLSSIGASAPVDYLIDSLLEPNKAIKENYHAVLVETSDGKQYTGIKVRQTKTELVLRTAEDREVSIPIKDVEGQSEGRSLMPDGLTDTLARGELVDLVRFLSEVGKVGPYAVSKARVARRWQVLEPTAEARQKLERTGVPAAVEGDRALPWMPAYANVAGELPLADVPMIRVGTDAGAVALARCELDVSTAGLVALRLNSAKGLRLWVDRRPVEVKEQMEIELTAGTHVLTFAVDPGARREGLRCELEDRPGATKGVRWVSGK
jgi:putative heme-binding domain-containing protein